MTHASLQMLISAIAAGQKKNNRPLAVILAGHNGSGKTTLWNAHLADMLQIPLINADRMMLSILPEIKQGQRLPDWATQIRDQNESWMQVAQKGVEAFVAQSMEKKVPFAMETVFSHWKVNKDGSIESKIDKIKQLQEHGYFVLLLFVGLTNTELSIARVQMRVSNINSGHDVPIPKLIARFPRTQKAIAQALNVADASILVDNSRKPERAFTLCHLKYQKKIIFDIRDKSKDPIPAEIEEWLKIVCPRTSGSLSSTGV